MTGAWRKGFGGWEERIGENMSASVPVDVVAYCGGLLSRRRREGVLDEARETDAEAE